MHMAWAADMLRGQLPVSPFCLSPGFRFRRGWPTQACASGGYQLSWEGLHRVYVHRHQRAHADLHALPSAGSPALAFVACGRHCRSHVSVANMYPKAFVSSRRRPGRLLCLSASSSTVVRFLLVALATAIAFLLCYYYAVRIRGRPRLFGFVCTATGEILKCSRADHRRLWYRQPGSWSRRGSSGFRSQDTPASIGAF